MPISRKELSDLVDADQGDLVARMRALFESSDDGYSALEVAAHLAGVQGRYEPLLDSKVQAILPAVEELLETLVRQKRLVKGTKRGGITAGPQDFYGRPAVEA